ncbi:sporulation initiation phosphotransferase B [Bacillus sp. 165]|uniref:sporulation initiation phosphotransferase B n=1 Tax=Bacillus sp. 165 TaxID=1529117 RepID=UPI001AD9B112|nr:sporulation initiation phosphotransferase B [Bacillus sp. 165]MBO9130496.1 sporulation initiation phosphotransferase B [Bacillus sp. 165]
MKKQWTVTDALRHSRHDWLNRLQLIKGHLSLGQMERVGELIERFVAESQSEARLMSLKLPLFTELLLTYSWEKHPCVLEYEVLGHIHNVSHMDESITNWSEQFIHVLNLCLDTYVENHLSVTIECKEKDVCFFFDFRGKLIDRERLEHWLANVEETLLEISYTCTEEEVSIELKERK